MIGIHPGSDKNKNKIFGICSFKMSTGVEITWTATMSNWEREMGKLKKISLCRIFKVSRTKAVYFFLLREKEVTEGKDDWNISRAKL